MQYSWALLAAAVLPGYAHALSPIQTYPIPAEVPKSTSYMINVRAPNGERQDVETYLVNLHEIDITTGSAKVHSNSLAIFDFDGTADISITYRSGNITSPRIRPSSYGFEYTVHDKTLTFSLSEPKDIVVQTTDSVFDVLHRLLFCSVSCV